MAASVEVVDVVPTVAVTSTLWAEEAVAALDVDAVVSVLTSAAVMAILGAVPAEESAVLAFVVVGSGA